VPETKRCTARIHGIDHIVSVEAVTPLPLAAQMWVSSREAARRLFEVVDTKAVISEPLSESSKHQAITNYELRVTDLSFTYPNQAAPVLQHITFSLEPGRSIAIVGRAARGKVRLPVCYCDSGITNRERSAWAASRSRCMQRTQSGNRSGMFPRILIFSTRPSMRISACTEASQPERSRVSGASRANP